MVADGAAQHRSRADRWLAFARHGRTVVLYVILASVLAVIVGHLNIPRYWRMLHDGHATHAMVVRTACDNHGSVYYRFEVSGREFAGVGNAGFGTPECDHF